MPSLQPRLSARIIGQMSDASAMISDETRAAFEAQCGRIITIKPLVGGFGGASALVHTDTDRDVVIHFPDPPLSNEKFDSFARLSKLAAQVITASSACAHGVAHGRVEWYAADFVPGTSSETVASAPADAQGEWLRSLGVVLARLHSLEFGAFEQRVGGPLFSSWSELVDDQIAAVGGRCVELGVYDALRLEHLRRRVTEVAAQVDSVVRPALVHRDLYFGNIVHGSWSVTGLIDFEHARIWDPVADMVKIELWVFPELSIDPREFWDAYEAEARTLPEYGDRLAVAQVLEGFAALPTWYGLDDARLIRQYTDMLESAARRLGA